MRRDEKCSWKRLSQRLFKQKHHYVCKHFFGWQLKLIQTRLRVHNECYWKSAAAHVRHHKSQTTCLLIVIWRWCLRVNFDYESAPLCSCVCCIFSTLSSRCWKRKSVSKRISKECALFVLICEWLALMYMNEPSNVAPFERPSRRT